MRRTVWALIAVSIAAVSSVAYYRYSIPRSASVRMGYLLGDIHQLAVPVALEKGYFAQEGLNVSLVGPFAAGPALMKAFAAGELDIGYVGTPPALTHAAKGVEIQILASVNNEGSALIVRRGVSRTEDLKGKTVAIPMVGSIQDVLLRMILSRSGMSYKDLNVVEVRPPDMPAQLEVGRLDGFIAWEPYCAQAVISGTGRILASSNDIWPGHPCCVLVASRSFIANQPSVVEKIVRIHVRATRFIQEHVEEATNIAARFTKLSVPVIEESWRRIQFDYEPKIEETKQFTQRLIEYEIIRKSDVTDLDNFMRSLFNTDFLKRVVGS